MNGKGLGGEGMYNPWETVEGVREATWVRLSAMNLCAFVTVVMISRGSGFVL